MAGSGPLKWERAYRIWRRDIPVSFRNSTSMYTLICRYRDIFDSEEVPLPFYLEVFSELRCDNENMFLVEFSASPHVLGSANCEPEPHGGLLPIAGERASARGPVAQKDLGRVFRVAYSLRLWMYINRISGLGLRFPRIRGTVFGAKGSGFQVA